MSEETRWPGECLEEVPGAFITVPPQPTQRKPGQLTEEQIKQYFDEGYLKVENFFSVEELQPCLRDIEDAVEDLAQKLLKAGKIKNLYSDLGVYQRLIELNREFPGANILLHKIGVLPKAFRTVWANNRLLNVVEQFLGTSDIRGHPVWNLRTKTPHNEEVTVPWHQDNGYLDNDAYHQHVVTAWIPLIDANEQNGCMQMAKFGHRKGRVAKHSCCAGGTWYVMLEEEEMRDTLGVDIENDLMIEPVNLGSILFFNNMTPHRSLQNVSKDVRWSLDLRWNRAQDPTGFFGCKDGIQMRSADNPDNYQITEEDWEKFDGVNRHEGHGEAEEVDPFDTTIPGPWMHKWEIVHVNRHTDALGKEDTLNIPPLVG